MRRFWIPAIVLGILLAATPPASSSDRDAVPSTETNPRPDASVVRVATSMGNIDIQLFEDAVHCRSASAIAGIDDNLDASRILELGGNVVHIGSHDVVLGT